MELSEKLEQIKSKIESSGWMWVQTEDVNNAKMICLSRGISIEFDIIPGDGYEPLKSFDDFEDSIKKLDFFNRSSRASYSKNYQTIHSEAFNFLVFTKGDMQKVHEKMNLNYYLE